MPYIQKQYAYDQYGSPDDVGSRLRSSSPLACVVTTTYVPDDYELARSEGTGRDYERAAREYDTAARHYEAYNDDEPYYGDNHRYEHRSAYADSRDFDARAFHAEPYPFLGISAHANTGNDPRVPRESPDSFEAKLDRQLEKAFKYHEDIHGLLEDHDRESARGSERKQGARRDLYDVERLLERTRLHALSQEAEKWVKEREYEVDVEREKADRLEELGRDYGKVGSKRVRFLLDPVD
ncbi:hypothetical protein LTR36_006488 [Oleoguttula mirabilis]|uniref:Uncharacterized protein n=1 Tax=Oleoguttula mirabilis TaxID=1507867 RepID=A0AAV9JUZ1_9PEZI|nr:hypothetical protein LTR36_006488 [Oleoguttula mirabilis]